MATPQVFLKKEAFSFGWRTVMENLGLFIALTCIVLGISFAPQILTRVGARSSSLIPLFGLGFWVFQIIVQIGILKIALGFCDGVVGTVSELFSQTRLFFRYLGASVLYGLIVAAGCVLLFVPGIVWGIKYGFFSYAIVDKNMGVMESLRWSATVTKGSKGNIFLFGLLAILVNLLGALALGVGLLVTIPTTLLANAYVYRKLVAVADASPVAPVPVATPVSA